MRKKIQLLVGIILLTTSTLTVSAQSFTVRGNVNNPENKDSVSGITIIIKETSEGTTTDHDGNFSITTKRKPPFTLVLTSVSFEKQQVNVTRDGQLVHFVLKPYVALGQDVVVSATRQASRGLESPVSIERVNSASIQK